MPLFTQVRGKVILRSSHRVLVAGIMLVVERDGTRLSSSGREEGNLLWQILCPW
jgi:hypothetical protein